MRKACVTAFEHDSSASSDKANLARSNRFAGSVHACAAALPSTQKSSYSGLHYMRSTVSARSLVAGWLQLLVLLAITFTPGHAGLAGSAPHDHGLETALASTGAILHVWPARQDWQRAATAAVTAASSALQQYGSDRRRQEHLQQFFVYTSYGGAPAGPSSTGSSRTKGSTASGLWGLYGDGSSGSSRLVRGRQHHAASVAASPYSSRQLLQPVPRPPDITLQVSCLAVPFSRILVHCRCRQ